MTLQADGKTLATASRRSSACAKAALPASIYTRTGAARLVLVTCGGPFDARAGHYRDNVIVTATPL